MRLDREGLKDRAEWEAAGFRLPGFDRGAVEAATRERPAWIHFGAGNIFRAFQANVAQTLLDQGVTDRGLVVAEGFDYELIDKIYRPHDNYSILVTLRADGNVEKTVVGSIVESCILDSGNPSEFERLREIFRNPSLQMASFTITEKGYGLTDGKGRVLPAVEADFAAGPERPASYMGKVASLLYARYLAGGTPLAMVSMDNCSHNGDRLWEAVRSFAQRWAKNKRAEEGFTAYVDDREKLTFPWTMIDKITPRPDASVEERLRRDGILGMEPVVTSRNTYAAPFVNAEECEYLVIEDAFPNGRPPLERGGILFTDRATVEKVERMKVCTCLNPLHTALAVFGCLLGYTKISEEMKDPQLRLLAEGIGYREGLPVAEDPGILHPREFMDTVLGLRIPNPFMPDTPQRIATDTSQKLGIRFGQTIRAYQNTDGLEPADLRLIPLVFAGWLRYLLAVDDAGRTFELSPDPMLDVLSPMFSRIKLGEAGHGEEILKPLLEREDIFGVDLYKAGMSELVLGYFEEMTAGPGAVRAVLERCVGTSDKA